MKLIPTSILLCIVIFATGCPKYSPKVNFKDSNTLVAKINEHIGTKRNEYDSAIFANPPDLVRAKRIRNELIENALPYIDSAYVDFITDIQAGRDRTNFMLDLVELGTAASVGITKGERPLQIIGVALTAFRGGRRSMDANFYKDQSTPILISKMDGNRAKVRATILNRERESPDDYSLGAAISDLVDYYNAGTLVRAFSQLAQDTAVITQRAEEDVLVLKGVELSRPSTAEITKEAQDALPVLAALSDDLESPDATVQAGALSKLQDIVKALEDDPEVAPFVKTAKITSENTDGKKLLAGLIAIKRAQRTDSDVNRKINQAINKIGK